MRGGLKNDYENKKRNKVQKFIICVAGKKKIKRAEKSELPYLAIMFDE